MEQSRAFLDSYLGRWDRNELHHIHDEDKEDEAGLAENAEECTSATSGEEIWGTPTSGENDEIQMFNSDQTVGLVFDFSTNRIKDFDCLFFF